MAQEQQNLSSMQGQIKNLEGQLQELKSQINWDKLDERTSDIEYSFKKLAKRIDLGVELNQNYETYTKRLDSSDYKRTYNSRFSLFPRYNSKSLTINGKIDFRYDSNNKVRRDIRTDEAYFEYSKGHWQFAGGKQKFKFGSAHIINPSNILNPVDYYDLLEQHQLGVWSASMKYFFSSSYVQVIAIPQFQPSNILDTKSRWIDFTGPALDVLADGAVLEYSIQETYYPDDPGFALVYRASGESVNLGLFYARLWDTIPTDVFQTVATPNVFNNSVYAVVLPYYDLKNYFGLDFQWLADKYLTVNIESVYGHTYKSTHPTNPQLKGDSDWVTIAGIEMPIGDHWRWVFEYSMRQIVTKNGLNNGSRLLNTDAQADLVPSGLKNAYTNNIMPAIRYESGDSWKFTLGGIFNTKDKSYVVRAESEHNLFKNLLLKYSYDSLNGTLNTSFWGIYRNNDRFNMQLTLNF